MNGVLGHDSALLGYTGPQTTWANEMNFVKNHASGTGSIARPIDHVQHATTVSMMHLVLKMKNNILNMENNRNTSNHTYVSCIW